MAIGHIYPMLERSRADGFSSIRSVSWAAERHSDRGHVISVSRGQLGREEQLRVDKLGANYFVRFKIWDQLSVRTDFDFKYWVRIVEVGI